MRRVLCQIGNSQQDFTVRMQQPTGLQNNGDLAMSMIICKETHGNFGAIILAIKEKLILTFN